MQYVEISLRDRNSTTEKESVDARVRISITGEDMQSERVASNKDGG